MPTCIDMSDDDNSDNNNGVKREVVKYINDELDSNSNVRCTYVYSSILNE